MAKSKNYNPADAFRKAQRAKELKKNKDERKKTRDARAVKSDTRELESEIRELKSRKLDDRGKERLAKLETEFKYVHNLKEKYVSEHPDARDRVFHTGPRRQQHGNDTDAGDEDGDGNGPGSQRGMGLYNEDGTLRDPKKSYYYDAIYNPFGVPPPGMPYRAVSDAEDEDEEEEEEGDEEDSDDEIVMPEGPPPEASDDDSDDSDDIPLPAGPPPPRQLPIARLPPHSLPTRPPPFSVPPRPPFGGPLNGGPQGLPPFPVRSFPGPHAGPSSRPPPHRRGPGAVPQATQDPLSDKPSTTFQAHRAHHGLPAKPTDAPASTGTPPPAPSTISAAPEGATISAAPVLRDLRKETTVFVPRGVKRKAAAAKSAPGAAAGVMVNAAPGGGVVDADGDTLRQPAGPGLMDKLQGVLGAPAPSTGGSNASGAGARLKDAGDDDYQAFLKGLGDIG